MHDESATMYHASSSVLQSSAPRSPATKISLLGFMGIAVALSFVCIVPSTFELLREPTSDLISRSDPISKEASSGATDFGIERHDCESFFLLDGRNPVELPETWAEAEDAFLQLCAQEGFSASFCQDAKRAAFRGYEATHRTEPFVGDANLCARFLNLAKAAEAQTFDRRLSEVDHLDKELQLRRKLNHVLPASAPQRANNRLAPAPQMDASLFAKASKGGLYYSGYERMDARTYQPRTYVPLEARVGCHESAGFSSSVEHCVDAARPPANRSDPATASPQCYRDKHGKSCEDYVAQGCNGAFQQDMNPAVACCACGGGLKVVPDVWKKRLIDPWEALDGRLDNPFVTQQKFQSLVAAKAYCLVRLDCVSFSANDGGHTVAVELYMSAADPYIPRFSSSILDHGWKTYVKKKAFVVQACDDTCVPTPLLHPSFNGSTESERTFWTRSARDDKIQDAVCHDEGANNPDLRYCSMGTDCGDCGPRFLWPPGFQTKDLAFKGGRSFDWDELVCSNSPAYLVNGCHDNSDFENAFGHGCDWYANDPVRCYNSDPYQASVACCACGKRNFTEDNYAVVAWHDSIGEHRGCNWYCEAAAHRCKLNFTWSRLNASLACCCCGGGQISLKASQMAELPDVSSSPISTLVTMLMFLVGLGCCIICACIA